MSTARKFPLLFERTPFNLPAGHQVGGASRDRTDDLKLAKLALSQLSYGPVLAERVVGPGGFEPPTPRLSSVCSNQLSYGPIRVEQHEDRRTPKGTQATKAWSLSFEERET